MYLATPPGGMQLFINTRGTSVRKPMERFVIRRDGATHRNASVTPKDLASHLENYLDGLRSNSNPSTVNNIRAEVNETCYRAASLPPSLFSLNVPTGGGKTLASLRFALRHAAINGMDGVVVAIPFTSIIDQNAAVYRDIFASLGRDIVLEHHSNLNPDDASESTTKRLQTENWDAPIVVTTNVQFFESLFACRTSRCRKLHRIVRRKSVDLPARSSDDYVVTVNEADVPSGITIHRLF